MNRMSCLQIGRLSPVGFLSLPFKMVCETILISMFVTKCGFPKCGSLHLGTGYKVTPKSNTWALALEYLGVKVLTSVHPLFTVKVWRQNLPSS